MLWVGATASPPMIMPSMVRSNAHQVAGERAARSPRRFHHHHDACALAFNECANDVAGLVLCTTMWPSPIPTDRPSSWPLPESWVITIERGAITVERLQQLEHVLARLGVERAQQLVAQQHRRLRHEGAGDRGALLETLEPARSARAWRVTPSCRGRAPSPAWARIFFTSHARADSTFSMAVMRGNRLKLWNTKPIVASCAKAPQAVVIEIRHVAIFEGVVALGRSVRDTRGC